MPKDVPTYWQYSWSDFMPNLFLDVVSISENTKHESCRVISYDSIKLWMIYIHGHY